MADEAGAPTRLDAALVEYSANGCRLWITLYLAEQAKALLRAGDTEGAEATIRRAFVEQGATGEHWAEAELNRISGEICLFPGRCSGGRAGVRNRHFSCTVSKSTLS